MIKKILLSFLKWIKNNRLSACILAAGMGLSLWAFFPSFFNGFVNWDDPAYLLNNTNIQSFSAANIYRIFTSYVLGNYHPLVQVTYAIEHHFFGLDPLIYHFDNYLLHLVNALLVFALIRKLTRSSFQASVVAGLFVLHPLRVESVVWVTERKDVLFSLFYLLAFLAYINFARKAVRIKLWYALTFILFAMSLLSKPSAATFPFVLVLFEAYENKSLLIRRIPRIIPFFMLSCVFIFIALKGTYTPFEPNYVVQIIFNAFDRLFLVPMAVLLYLKKTLLPVFLSAFYPMPEKVDGQLPFAYYLSPAILAGLLVLLLRSRPCRKECKFGLAFFILTISLNLPFLSVGKTIIADRFTYLPHIGLFMVAAFYLELLKSKNMGRKFSIAAISMALLSCSVLTHQRCRIWKNSLALWTNVIQQCPSCAAAYYNRAEILAQNKMFDLAIADYSQTIKYNPLYFAAFNNRGNMYFMRAEFTKALENYDQAVHLNPRYIDAYSNRGMLYFSLGDNARAKMDFEKVLTLDPHNKYALEKLDLLNMP